MCARLATQKDVDGLVETVTLAFMDDPLWSFAFPASDAQHHQFELWWRIFVESGFRYPCTWVTERCEAMALWIPPGGVELTPDEEASLEQILRGFAQERASVVVEIMDHLEQAHPHDVPHYYLSLLATHPRYRGQGLGMGLLAETLSVIDAEQVPAYLESSNQANDVRYARLGFEPLAMIDLSAMGGPRVTTMWREPRKRQFVAG
jgi:GNAT superfamily N-acetyltransferase